MEIFTSSDRRRAIAYAFVGGVRTLRRFPGLVSLTATIVTVSIFIGLLSTVMSSLASAGSVELVRATTIVAVLDESAGDEVTARLTRMAGIESQRPATFSDLTEVQQWYGAAPNASEPAVVLELSGTRGTEEILTPLRNIDGVLRAAVSVGDDFYLMKDFMATVASWFSVLLVGGAILMIANLARMVAAMGLDEAATMRLVGADRFSVWVAVGAPACVIVLAAGAVALIGFGGLYLIAINGLLSPQAVASLDITRLLLNASAFIAVIMAASIITSWFQLRRAAAT